jgi:hypothetical protein|tara:strand:- start:570 stop:1361 length:792 start_codon:yes stop_codon:yes gene_type:complete
LSPFSKSKDPEVIPIFETSVHFQGYFAQSFSHLPKDCDYYVFCGDDLILNPCLNESNLINILNCNETSYIKYLNPIWEHSFAWHKFEECNEFTEKEYTVPYQNLLPSRKELLKIYESHGLKYRNLGFHNFQGIKEKGITTNRIKSGVSYFLRNGNRRFINYPLVEGYSDLIVIHQDHLELFCYYCGIFSAMNLWVDAAVATALLLSGSHVRTEIDSKYSGSVYWNKDELKKRLSPTNNKLDNISEVFKENELYIHPIKLSSYN